jgi:hypothetical protein
MKNIFLLLSIAFTLFSCSSDNTSSTVNPNLLQRVDFCPGTTFEERWLFNADGLLYEITKADGTLVEKFIYDEDNNVIQDIKYSSGSPSENYIISYNSSNIIISINEKNYNYSISENRYFYTLGYESFSCELNTDGIATHYLDFFDFPDEDNDIQTEFNFQYENGNILSYSGFGNNMNEIEIHFNYGNVINPLKTAILPVLRIKSILEPSFFKAGISFNKVKEYQTYAVGDPETHSFGILIYPSNKIELLIQENFSNAVFESSLTNSYYYYQGDVIP